MTLRSMLRWLLAPMWAGMCYLFGGDSDSSQTTNQFDKRVTGRDGAQISGDGNTVSVALTDYGAVSAGFESARDSTRTAAAVALASLSAGKGMFDAALSNTQKTFAGAIASVDKAYETGRAGDQRELSMVAMAAVAVVAAVALFSGKR